VAEIIYLILKQNLDFQAGETESQIKKDNEIFVKRLTVMQDLLVKKFKLETVAKVLERLIKNEKFHCKILISMILLLLKHNSPDQKGTDSTFKEQALQLIKWILKKKAWELI